MDYKKILEGVVDIINTTEKSDIGFANICAYIGENCPELKESEDERIRKDIIVLVKDWWDRVNKDNISTKEQMIAWLEKQGSEPNWCHHKVDLSECSEEYRKAYYDGWNNCNMQHSQCKSELDDVVKCLINGMKFYYEDNKEATWGTDKWSMPVKHIIEVLEKQDKQKPTDKVEPKFKVGDKIQYLKGCGTIMTIEKIENGEYIFGNNMGHTTIESGNKWHLVEQKSAWSEEDEKMINKLIDFMLSGIDISKAPYGCVAWLKSLKERYTWKPSDEQMEALEQWLRNNRYKGDARYCYPIFDSLYKQLKKLKE